MTNRAAASPRFRPRRLRLKGFVRSEATASRALKPRAVMGARVSTPPAITASHRSSSKSERALTRALALEEQAVETV
jgi:hypothetical protein